MRNITTIIAHKNYLNYLNKAVKSAEEQTYKNRICVIDDGSKCDVEDLLNAVFNNDRNLDQVVLPGNIGVLFSNGEKDLFIMGVSAGPSAARNIGIKYHIEKTDAFMILDADDMMMPTKVEKFVEEMEKSWDNIGVVYADYLINKGDYTTMEFKKSYNKNLLKNECIIHSGSLINKKVFESVGLYDESFRVCEDYDLWLRMSEKFIAVHIPEFLTEVLDHQENSTNTVNSNIWQESWLRLKKKHEKIYS